MATGQGPLKWTLAKFMFCRLQHAQTHLTNETQKVKTFEAYFSKK